MTIAEIAPFMTLTGTLTASGVALWIATKGWQKADHRAQQDKDDSARGRQAVSLAELLELHFDSVAAGHLTKNDARMKAILLTLPGHLATTLRVRLKLGYTMNDVALDVASAERLAAITTIQNDAGGKWMIFDRSSVLKGRGFQPYPEWIEAELAYDIAGLRGGDQEAVLHALSKDERDTRTAVMGRLQQHKQQREIEGGEA